MPELPEVETIARQLAEEVRDDRVRRIRVLDARLSGFPVGRAAGRRILDVYRYGKQVAVSLEGDRIILIHLRMTGRLLVRRDLARPLGAFLHAVSTAEQHVRATFELDRCELLFADTRRFGTLELHDAGRLPVIGLDPTSGELTGPKLAELLSGSRQPLKEWLLRQDRLVGIGNIYASEILHRAKLHPGRHAGSLSRGEVVRLHECIRAVLDDAIRFGGTTFSDYRQSDGTQGGFGARLRTYERAGEPCFDCGGMIERQVTAGRSTYFCPACQPLGRKRPPGREKVRRAR